VAVWDLVPKEVNKLHARRLQQWQLIQLLTLQLGHDKLIQVHVKRLRCNKQLSCPIVIGVRADASSDQQVDHVRFVEPVLDAVLLISRHELVDLVAYQSRHLTLEALGKLLNKFHALAPSGL
jgi:hypothetical protein